MITVAFYLAMVVAGYVVEILFAATGLSPDRKMAHMPDEGISWNYTTWLNLLFLTLAAVLVWRFIRTGGVGMPAMMGGAPDTDHSAHGTHQHSEGSGPEQARQHHENTGDHHHHGDTADGGHRHGPDAHRHHGTHPDPRSTP